MLGTGIRFTNTLETQATEIPLNVNNVSADRVFGANRGLYRIGFERGWRLNVPTLD